jgi:hypothetical protein
MRTNDMIYQAAIAHQRELRRSASGRTAKSGRNGGPSGQNRLLSLIVSRARARATTRPAASGIGTPRVSV